MISETDETEVVSVDGFSYYSESQILIEFKNQWNKEITRVVSETSTRSILAYKSITHQSVFERANPSAKRPQTGYTLGLEQVTSTSEGEDTPIKLKKSDINVGIDETILEEEEATFVVKKPDLSFNQQFR